jgi:Flp pilus assembly protein TadD
MLREYSIAQEYLASLQDRRAEWPDPLIALNGRLLTRQGRLSEAAQEFSKVLIVGPEDFGVNYYLGIICLGYGKLAEARQYFLRAFSTYMVDSLEFQWWQLEQVLLNPQEQV